jgi:hypothetical protein
LVKAEIVQIVGAAVVAAGVGVEFGVGWSLIVTGALVIMGGAVAELAVGDPVPTGTEGEVPTDGPGSTD